MPEGKSDLHPSVQALMAEARKGESTEDIIRRKAWTMVADAKKNNWQGPPYDPELLAEINGIKVKEAQCDIPLPKIDAKDASDVLALLGIS